MACRFSTIGSGLKVVNGGCSTFEFVLRCRWARESRAETDWHVLVDQEYPLGSIKFFPSKKNGLSETYPHQLYNGPGTNETYGGQGALPQHASPKVRSV